MHSPGFPLLARGEYGTIAFTSGYGLVVERVLAKDESGVRFSLPALRGISIFLIHFIHKKNWSKPERGRDRCVPGVYRGTFLSTYTIQSVDNPVGTGDYGQCPRYNMAYMFGFSSTPKKDDQEGFESISPKEVGKRGEDAVALYLSRKGFSLVARNVLRKTGELDVVVKKGNTLHAVEVKTMLCKEFPEEGHGGFDPSFNLHQGKTQKVARTLEWYVAEKHWKGEWQVDGAVVWLRARDGLLRVIYLPQIL